MMNEAFIQKPCVSHEPYISRNKATVTKYATVQTGWNFRLVPKSQCPSVLISNYG